MVGYVGVKLDFLASRDIEDEAANALLAWAARTAPDLASR